MNLNIADGNLLRKSLTRLKQSPDFWKKLSWGIKLGASLERPLQFSWAYEIEQFLHENKRHDLHVICEQGRVDIGIRKLNPSELEVALELKQWGNWWFDIPKFRDDISKVNLLKIPAAAILICVFAQKSDDYPVNHWMWDRSQRRIESVEELEEKLKDLNLITLDKSQEPEPKSPMNLSLWVGAHFNESARGQLGSIITPP